MAGLVIVVSMVVDAVVVIVVLNVKVVLGIVEVVVVLVVKWMSDGWRGGVGLAP